MTTPEVDPSAPAPEDRLAGLIEAAGDDQRARRKLLDRASRVLADDAEAERRARAAQADAERRAKAAETDAEARIRAAEAQLRVRERERQAERVEREATRADQAAERQDRAEVAAERRAAWGRRREAMAAFAPACLSMLVYSAAVGSAVFGQLSVATSRYHWPAWRALVLAGFIELMALAMALTANNLRLRGERAVAPRVLTWVFASFAAAVNVWGHFQDPLMALGLGAASLGGITLWEIRSSARHRKELRAAGQLAHPLPSLGLRFWCLERRTAMAAYRIAVRTGISEAAAPLVARAEAELAARADQAEADRRERVEAAERESIRAVAIRTAKRAARKGDPEALAALTRLALSAPGGPQTDLVADLGRSSDGPATDLTADPKRTSSGPGNGPRTDLARTSNGPLADLETDLTADLGRTSGGPGNGPQTDLVADLGRSSDGPATDLTADPKRTSDGPRTDLTADPKRTSDGPGTDLVPVPTRTRVTAPGQDVKSLLPAAREVARELSATGVSVSRASLAPALRQRGIPVSTSMAGQLARSIKAGGRAPRGARRTPAIKRTR